jgi:polyisoprenyl-phosphate glycosyltransferase
MIPKISIVTPVYKAENIVDELIMRIKSNVEQFTSEYEIILVEDKGPDNSWERIAAHSKQDSRIVGIGLSRNFGQHYAITAGIDHAKGEWIVVMDCDLQDDPAEIINLYNKAVNENWDVVLARRFRRKDGFFKKLSSRIFYRLFSYFTGLSYDGTVANFGIYNRKVIDVVKQMREPMRSFPSMIAWVGFKKGFVDVNHQARFEGRSSYNWKKLVNLAMDIILAYSDKPLKITVKFGFTIAITSFLVACGYLAAYLFGYISVSGFASLIISIWFLSGLMILILGILGLYLGKVFEAVKNRPLYIIDKKLN